MTKEIDLRKDRCRWNTHGRSRSEGRSSTAYYEEYVIYDLFVNNLNKCKVYTFTSINPVDG